MIVQNNLLIIELNNYVFRMEYLLLRYVYGLKLIYFYIKNNFCFESKLANVVMCILRLTINFIILVYGLWS